MECTSPLWCKCGICQRMFQLLYTNLKRTGLIKYLPYLWSPIFSNTTSNIYVVCFQWRPTPREFAWNPETTCWKKDAMPRKSHRATWNAASATQTIVTLQPPWLLQFSRSFCAQWCQCFTIWCGEECLNQFKCGINEIQF